MTCLSTRIVRFVDETLLVLGSMMLSHSVQGHTTCVAAPSGAQHNYESVIAPCAKKPTICFLNGILLRRIGSRLLQRTIQSRRGRNATPSAH